MLNLGLLGFTTPWILAALVLLPALWWLLRLMPPSPRRLRFPAVRFLLGLVSREETPARTPPWLLVLRMLLVTLVILALAGPVWNPEAEPRGQGPLVLVVDDGWAAAPGWSDRLATLERLTERAVRDGREVVLLGTAGDARGPQAQRLSATEAAQSVPGWQPRPWPVDREAARAALARLGLERGEPVWLTDGVAGDGDARLAARALAGDLQALGRLRVIADEPGDRAPLLLPPATGGDGLVVRAQRPVAEGEPALEVAAVGAGGEVLAREPLPFAAESTFAELRLDLPLEMRNRIARLQLEPHRAVGGVVLFDERWRRRVVGVIGPSSPEEGDAQPLLSETYYMERALGPYAELRHGGVAGLLEGRLSVMLMPDMARIERGERERLEAWIADGGVLLRFAGPRLASGGDDLVPVQLRAGDRQLGGALSWAQPLALASFDEDGPLAGVRVPDDVLVQRQVLAQPGPELGQRTWARLEDGTPLITGERRGEGWLALVHTTANTTWSDFALSGTFVEVLRRLVALAPGIGGEARGTLAPLQVLDAQGRLVGPEATALPIEAEAFEATVVGPRHPPGLYGAGGMGDDLPRQALNLASAVPDLQPLTAGDLGATVELFTVSREIDLTPWILTAALILAIADMLIALALRGQLPRLRPRAAGTAAVLALVALPATADDERILAAVAETRLAYVVTGIAEVDEISEAGLWGLSRVLTRRTAVEPADPMGVEVDGDELALYPLLYWPVPPEHPSLSPGAIERIDAYLRGGGMILFDTRDGGGAIPGRDVAGPGERRLAEILDGLDVPPLMPVPEEHALTRAFYLLQEFPGRYAGQRVWIDEPRPGVNDEVSSIVIGAHDWAGAWAMDEYGQALLPVQPGGERQREMARRFGVNLVMYALTGNYKTDQVHVPALLERLGQ
jgi:hypothetical protein